MPFSSNKGPFARDVDHARFEATGLGLTVCRHIMALHGGHLELKSSAGQGTTAAMVLPIAATHAHPNMPAAPENAETLGERRGVSLPVQPKVLN